MYQSLSIRAGIVNIMGMPKRRKKLIFGKHRKQNIARLGKSAECAIVVEAGNFISR
ncbi:hypothetical protein [Nitrosomonas sp. Nm166]|uniref:hypothetical protein n=1 Tax=Nitrosomonas sp. Nm166 TaxID=1881054 RepID=UPI0015A55B27|nr:hypothetical protein [Nitrosomonas sp. Nm166]